MDLPTLTLARAQQMLDQREISSLELTEFFLDRITRYDRHLTTFITVVADSARDEARRCDAERARGVVRSPLHGVPYALKDLFWTRGIRTTAGSKILQDLVPESDAGVVTRLRQAGGVLLGKLNMHEIAYGVTNNNPHFGRAKNPWAPDRLTGGSSGGSAAAVSARLCPAALGSDTGGSIRIPSALCGVTGIKPTYGRVSLNGVVPLCWSMDHAGPIAQTALDCALLLEVISGYDPDDPVSADIPVPPFGQLLNGSIRGLRLAAPRGFFEDRVDPVVRRAVDEAVAVFESLGVVRVSKEMEFAEEMYRMNRTVLPAEAAAYHRDNLTARPNDFGADVLIRLRSNAKILMSDYAWARRRQVELTRQLELYMMDVDVIAIPTTRVPAPTADADAVVEAENLTAFTAPFNLTGFPALSLPCGFTENGLPIGLQLVGRKWEEGLILQAAHQYQLVTDWHTRIPPI